MPTFLALFTLIFYLPKPVKAQCLCSDGSPALTQQHIVTQNFSSNSTTMLNMPKFDAETGFLVCVNAKIFLTSILRMRLENDEVFAIDYSVRYQRKDTLSGPGIDPSVTGSRNKNYGPYSLGASDGNTFAGPDYVSIGPDTIYNNKLYETTTTDILPYLGEGTIDFMYKSAVNTFAIGSDVYALAVTSQNSLQFVMTYSYCNTAVLPLNITNFHAYMKGFDAFISWTAENEIKTNTYEIQFSENGKQFYTIGAAAPSTAEGTTAKYEYQHHFDKSFAGYLYFRIKQINGNEITYADIKAVRMEKSVDSRIGIYPNPVVREINMEFDEPVTGDFHIELTNQVGQIVYKKEMKLLNNTRIRVAVSNPPKPGIYYLRATQSGSSKVYSGKLLFTR